MLSHCYLLCVFCCLLCSNYSFHVCFLVLYVLFLFCVTCVFVSFCALFLFMYVVDSFQFVYKFTDHCHRMHSLGTNSGNIKDSRCTWTRNTEARSRNHCCREKAISVTHAERASVSLIIQRAKRTRRIILSSVASLAQPRFLFTSSHKRHEFRETKMAVLIFSTFFWNILTLRRIQRDSVINMQSVRVK